MSTEQHTLAGSSQGLPWEAWPEIPHVAVASKQRMSRLMLETVLPHVSKRSMCVGAQLQWTMLGADLDLLCVTYP